MNLVNLKKTVRPYEILVDYISSLDYGESLTHEDISDVIGIDYAHYKYRGEVNKAQKELIKKGKMLKSVRYKGYRVLEPDSYYEEAERRLCHGRNDLQRAVDIIQYAPKHLMSQSVAKLFDDLENRFVSLYASLEGGLKSVKILQKPPRKLRDFND